MEMPAAGAPIKAPTVDRVARVALVVSPKAWPFAYENAARTDAHWDVRRAANPKFFNGTIFCLTEGGLDGDSFTGALIRVAFKDFLFWREHDCPATGLRDAFGSAIVIAADGAVLLVQQRPGHINEGLSYLPGGFIDARDVEAGGQVDITANVLREVQEETGLAEELEVEPGFLVTQVGSQVSFGVVLRSALVGAELADRVRRFITSDPEGELAEVVMVSALPDLDSHEVPVYARAVIEYLFARRAVP